MKGRDNQFKPLGSVVKKMLTEYSLDRKYDEMDLISSWRSIVGDPIANRTIQLFIKSDTLYVKIESAPMKHELSMSTDKILKMIENELGQKIVKQLVLL